MISEVAMLKQTDDGAVEMGVLSDGTAFLTQRGLARLCGVQHNAISTQTEAWAVKRGELTEEQAKQILAAAQPKKLKS